MTTDWDSDPDEWPLAERLFSGPEGYFAGDLVIVGLLLAIFPAFVVAWPLVAAGYALPGGGIVYVVAFVYLGTKWDVFEQTISTCHMLAAAALAFPFLTAWSASEVAPTALSGSLASGLGLLILAPVALLFAAVFAAAGWYLSQRAG